MLVAHATFRAERNLERAQRCHRHGLKEWSWIKQGTPHQTRNNSNHIIPSEQPIRGNTSKADPPNSLLRRAYLSLVSGRLQYTVNSTYVVLFSLCSAKLVCRAGFNWV